MKAKAISALTMTQAVTDYQTEERLIAVLEVADASRKDKADACLMLARYGGEACVDVVAPLLRDEELSHMARYALEPNPSPAVDPALREALKDVDGKLLVGIIQSIGKRRDGNAVPHLKDYLSDENDPVSMAAARALGRMGTVATAEALMEGFESANGSPARSSAIADALLDCAENLKKSGFAHEALEIYDYLRSCSLDSGMPLQTAALRGAVHLRGRKGVSILLDLVEHGDVDETRIAMGIAQEMEGGYVGRALAERVARVPHEKQVLIIQTLGVRGDQDALPVLTQLAHHENAQVSEAARKAIAEISDLQLQVH